MKNINLNTTKINAGFKVPEDYFAQLESKMLEKIEVKKEIKVVPLYYKKQIWISSIAAVFVLALVIPAYFNSVETIALENATIENYLVNQSGFSSLNLIENLNETDIKELENSLNLSDNNSVELYLLDTQNLDYYLNE